MEVARQDAQLVHRLWLVWRTIKKMCHDRKYLVIQEELNMEQDTFAEEVLAGGERQNLNFVVPHNDDPTDQLFVFWPNDPEVGVEPIKLYFTRMQEQSIFNGLVIIQNKLTPLARNAIVSMLPKYKLEVFKEAELVVNITEHALVPTHKVLNSDQKATLLKRYNITEEQLGRIQETDPIARYFGLERGQVLEIIRQSETAGRYVTYRICL